MPSDLGLQERKVVEKQHRCRNGPLSLIFLCKHPKTQHISRLV